MNKIEKLIERARNYSKGRNNNGRPYQGFPQRELRVVEAMEKAGCSFKAIHKVMKEDNLTTYDKYGAFLNAYKEHLLHK